MTDLVKVSHDRAKIYLHLWCPGCQDHHMVPVARRGSGATWDWNDSRTAPTISPSILVTGGSYGITCHSFVRDGQWQFLTDSTHHLAGQTVPMVPVSQWPY